MGQLHICDVCHGQNQAIGIGEDKPVEDDEEIGEHSTDPQSGTLFFASMVVLMCSITTIICVAIIANVMKAG